VIGGDIIVESRIVLGVDDFNILVGLEAQTQPLDPPCQYIATGNQNRPAQAIVEGDLHGAEDAFVLALGKGDPLRGLFCPVENRPHDQLGTVDELFQFLPVSRHILDRPCGNARIHSRLRNRRSQRNDQARIEGFRDQIIRPETGRCIAIG